MESRAPAPSPSQITQHSAPPHAASTLQPANSTSKVSATPRSNAPFLADIYNWLKTLETRYNNVSTGLKGNAATTDPAKLLALQKEIYDIGEQIELASKIVDQTTTGTKSLLQIQL
jgi:hypothetical protein